MRKVSRRHVILNSIGVAAFALKYRLGREQGTPYSIEKHAREDGERAMRLVRSRAQEWNLDPARIGIMGFSAGGEVASMVAFGNGEGSSSAPDPVDRLSSRPNFLVMIYPGPLGIPKEIPPKSPPAFLLVANDDRRHGPDDRQSLSEIPRRQGTRRGPRLCREAATHSIWGIGRSWQP